MLKEEIEKIVLLCVGISIIVLLIVVLFKEYFSSLRKRKIQKILQQQNIQAYCINRIKLNGQKYLIYQDINDNKEYLVDLRGRIRGFKRKF